MNALTVTREDGSEFTIGDARVSCEPIRGFPESGLLFVLGGIDGPGPIGPQADAPTYFQLMVTFGGEIDEPVTLELPLADGAEGQPTASLFVNDHHTGNELSSTAKQSTGHIMLTKASCDPARIEASVDMQLGSEFSDESSADVSGQLGLQEAE